MHSRSCHPTRCRSQALRSKRVVLSRSSSLQGLSDSHSRRHRITYTLRYSLPSYSSRRGRRRCGSQLLHLLPFSACHHHYPGSLVGANSHYFPTSNGLLSTRKKSACHVAQRRRYPGNPTLPAKFVGPKHHGATVFALCCGLLIRLAPRTG